MQCRIRDLRCKEVINICDGCRIINLYPKEQLSIDF